MTDMFELLRAANPIPEPTPFAADARERLANRIVARDRRTRRLERIIAALTRSRVLALAAGAALLAGGASAAVVALTG